jgi:hypothetical protein
MGAEFSQKLSFTGRAPRDGAHAVAGVRMQGSFRLAFLFELFQMDEVRDHFLCCEVIEQA